MVKLQSFFLPLALANRHRRDTTEVQSISNAFDAWVTLANAGTHGCHCKELTGEPGFPGVPIDALDKTCQAWQSSRNCLLLEGGACSDSDTKHDLPAYDASAGNCDALTAGTCEKALCDLDKYFSEQINTSTVTINELTDPSTECEHVDSPMDYIQHYDSCCAYNDGTDFTYRRYNAVQQVCTDQGLVINQDCGEGQERVSSGECQDCASGMYSNGNSHCVACNEVSDLFIIYDGSGSMKNDGKWDQQKQFVKTLVTSFDIGENKTRVASNQYNQNTVMNWSFEEGSDAAAVEQLATDIAHADRNSCGYCSQFSRSYKQAKNKIVAEGRLSEGVTTSVIVFADGYNHGTPSKHPDLVDALAWFRDNEVQVYMIRVGSGDLDGRSPEWYASTPSNAFETGADGWAGLTGIADLIKNRVCTANLYRV